MRLFLSAALVTAAILPKDTFAATINVDANGNPWEVFHYRNRAGPNSVGFSQEDRLIYGAVNVTPNGKGEDDGTVVSATPTTAVARQGGFERAMSDFPTTVNPNQFAASSEYLEELTGAWEFEFTNGPDTLIVQTPEVGDAPAIERVTNMRITSGASSTTPTFAWDAVPEIDSYTISIYDQTQRNSSGFPDRIFVSGTGGKLSFTIPDGQLSEDGIFTIEVQTRINRETGTNPSGSSQAGAAISINRTFFDFTLLDLPQEGDIFLPEVDNNTGVPTFNFNNPVLANQIQFYDPLVAIGYDYMIGEGNPLFSSFILPGIGDDLFDLLLWDGTDYIFDKQVMAGTEYFFAGGADRFRILGVETDVLLDPNDPTAFVTGLSFVSSGQFTGTMTPITTFVDDPSVVPLPATLPMLAFGLCGFAYFRRKAAKGDATS